MWLHLIWMTCGFGERIINVFYIFLITVVSFTFLYTYDMSACIQTLLPNLPNAFLLSLSALSNMGLDLNNMNYKSKLNRDTFVNKTLEHSKNTILKVVDNDLDKFNEVYNIFKIRLEDRVNRLESINSQEKFDYVVKSIIDETQSLELLLEMNDEEK